MAMEAQAAVPVSLPVTAPPDSEQQAVSQPPRELKTKDLKTFRVTVRFSEAERQIVVRRAAQAGLTPSEYARIAALGVSAAPPDPAWRQLLTSAERELTRQNGHLDQIDRQLKGKIASPEQGDSMVGIIARSLLSAHRAVRQALNDDSYKP